MFSESISLDMFCGKKICIRVTIYFVQGRCGCVSVCVRVCTY